MTIKKLSNNVAVSSQISVADLELIKNSGYKIIVCNRPDGESADQTDFSEIQEKARELGLKAIYQPVISGQIKEKDVEDFKQILSQSTAPLFAYCKSGNRCSILWSLANLGLLPISQILDVTKKAGYDVSKFINNSELI